MSEQMFVLPEGYELRREQMDFIESASAALKSKRMFFCDAACGTGKSLAALLTVLPLLKDSRLVVCFRTRDQMAIYLKELRALKTSGLVVCLSNKQIMCPNEAIKRSIVEKQRRRLSEKQLKERMKSIPYRVFVEACEYWKENKRCSFFDKSERAIQYAKECAHAMLDPIASSEMLAEKRICAYEALKQLVPEAKIFLGTYHYVFNSLVSKRVFPNGFSNCYLIVDEAHNLHSFARENLSAKVTNNTIEAALKECSYYPNPLYSVDVRRILLDLQTYFQGMSNFLEPEDMELFTVEHMNRLIGDSPSIYKFLEAYGRSVLKKMKALEKGYSSYCLRIGEFIKQFYENQKGNFLHTVEKRGENVAVCSYCLDARSLTDRTLRGNRGAILMSGTLSPLEVYRDLLLYSPENTTLASYSNPFPQSNRLVLSVNGVSSKTSRRGEEMDIRISQFLGAIAHANKGNIAVFFTSYKGMETVLKLMQDVPRTCWIEDRQTKRSEIIKHLEGGVDNMIFGVMGGKLSEGIDYHRNILTCVVVVGLPYAPWSLYQRTLISYYSGLYPGRGALYAYDTPALLRLVQTSGRVHRTPTDKGCIVLMEDRLRSLKDYLPEYIQSETKTIISPEECYSEIQKFWETDVNST